MAWNTLQASVKLHNSLNNSITFLSGLTVDFNLCGSENNITYHATAVTNAEGTASIGNIVSSFTATTLVERVNSNGRLDEGGSDRTIQVSSIDADKWSIHTTYNGIEKSTEYIDLTSARTQNQIITFEYSEESQPPVYAETINFSVNLHKTPVSGALVYMWPCWDNGNGGYSSANAYVLSGVSDSNGNVSFEITHPNITAFRFTCYYDSGSIRYEVQQGPYDNVITGSTHNKWVEVMYNTNGWFGYVSVFTYEGVSNNPLTNCNVYLYGSINNTSTLFASGNTSTYDPTYQNHFVGDYEYLDDFQIKIVVTNTTFGINHTEYVNIDGEYGKIVLLYLYLPDYTVRLPKVLDTTFIDGVFNLPNALYELYDNSYETLIMSGYTTIGSASTISLSDYNGEPYYLQVSKHHYNTEFRQVYLSSNTMSARELFFTKINGALLTHMTITRESDVCMIKSDLKDYVDAFYGRNLTAAGSPNIFDTTSEKVPASMVSFYDECTDLVGWGPQQASIAEFKHRFIDRLYDIESATAITTLYVDGPFGDETSNEEAYDYTFDSEHCYVLDKTFIPDLDFGPYLTFRFIGNKDASYVQNGNTGTINRGGGGVIDRQYGTVTLNKIGNPYQAEFEYRFIDLDNLDHPIGWNDYDWMDYTLGEPQNLIQSSMLLQFRRKPREIEDTDFDMRLSKDTSNYYQFTTSGHRMNVYGYVNTLLDSMNSISSLAFLDNHSGSTDYTFYRLFKDCTNIDTDGLYVNAKVLSPFCYSEMFMGDTGIIHSPFLREDADFSDYYLLSVGCCQRMFYNCENMETFPFVMFSNNSDYYYYPELCFDTMFKNCYNIERSNLPMHGDIFVLTPPLEDNIVLVVRSGCCASMFSNCTKLKTVFCTNPPTNTLTISQYSFDQMFSGCTSLTTGLNLFQISVVETGACNAMYCGCERLGNSFAFELIAGSEVQSHGCSYMFMDCKKLSKTLNLYSNTIGDYAFHHCFENAGINGSGFIANLNTASTTTLSEGSFSYMFYNAKIKNSPIISATTIPVKACQYMFSKSSLSGGLETMFIENLATVSNYGCQHMFEDCTHLSFNPYKSSPSIAVDSEGFSYKYYTESQFNKIKLNATSLGEYCYSYMFAGCTALSGLTSWYLKYSNNYRLPTNKFTYYVNGISGATATCEYYTGYFSASTLVRHINLPAATLNKGSYYHMFDGCVSLEYAVPISGVTTLNEASCAYMFNGCKFSNIAPTIKKIGIKSGEFYTTWWGTLDEDVSPIFQTENDMMKSLKLYNLKRDSDFFLNSAVTSTDGTMQGKIYRIKNSGVYDAVSTTNLGNNKFRTKIFRKSGVRYFGQTYENHNSLGFNEICPTGVLFGHHEIVSNNILSTEYKLRAATKKSCYYSMFANNPNLKDASALNMTNNNNSLIEESCCERMFENCGSLIYPPIFDNSSAKSANTACYRYMFRNCKSLRFPVFNNYSNSLNAKVLREECYLAMYSNCHMLESTPNLSCATTLSQNCCASMFANCNRLKSHPVLNSQTLVTGCYNYMFTNACQWHHNLLGYIWQSTYRINLGGFSENIYYSFNDIPSDVRNNGHYFKVKTGETSVVKFNQSITDSNSSYTEIEESLTPFWVGEEAYLVYDFWWWDESGNTHTYTQPDSGFKTIRVSSNFMSKNFKGDGYHSPLDRFVNASFKGTFSGTGANRVISKIFKNGNNWYFANGESPVVPASNVIYGGPSGNARYIKTLDRFVTIQEDGHDEEFVYGLREITVLSTTSPSSTYTNNWTLELDCTTHWFEDTISTSGELHEGSFTKKSGVSWQTGSHGIPPNWDVTNV